jgi:NAD(P)-dependent dehydrogenase (short-subunit alcohol dehydrogenase family)
MATVHHVAPESSVIVTGAARGIGAAIADRFATDGYRVVGVDLEEQALAQTVGELPGRGHVALAADVTQASVIEQAVAAALAGEHALSALVLNAGVIRPGPSTDFPLESWDLVQDVLLKAVFVGARTAVTHMSPGSSIVIMSSLSGLLGFGERAAYCAAKAGTQGLTRSLAVEWAGRGIRVNAVAPGSIATGLQQSMIAGGFASEEVYLSHVPMQRFGEPSEIADAVAFLASTRASYITGQILTVDGGWQMFGMHGQG